MTSSSIYLSISSSLHRIAIWIILAFLCSAIIRFMLMIDVNKRVYNHTPGPCRIIPDMFNGSSGMELVKEADLIFITYGLSNGYDIDGIKPGIAMYDINQKDQKHQVEKLKIEGENFNQDKFAPSGISSYYSKGKISLYIVNSYPTRQCIEMFSFNKDKKALFHRKSICDASFTSLSDVVAIGADKIFFTNMAYFSKGALQTAELAMQSNFGTLFYSDGHLVRRIESRLSTSGGLAIDRQRSLIFIGSLLNENIRVYSLGKDLSLEYRTEISLLSSPNGIHIDEESGDIWVALHPVLYQTFFHLQDPSNKKIRSPSQVLRVRIQSDGVSWVITEPYANDGATISGSSSVIYHKEQLLIGSLFGRLLHCDVLNPQIT